MNKIRTRFAPSPTGYMHIGNLRTALYEYLIAKKDPNGEFLIRIEDTDQERLVDGAVEIIFDTLKQCNIIHDEGPDIGGEFGPYVQSERMKSGMYLEYAKKLIDLGGAHYCFCNDEDVKKQKQIAEAKGMSYKFDDPCRSLSNDQALKRVNDGETYVIRQTIKPDGTTSFNDEVYGVITVENSTLDEGVLLKSDGFPTYNFANIVDDHLMNITHVVRGNEYLSSTPKYNLVYEAFGWDIPVYVHCPPVMKDEYNKLSKRNGDASFQDLIKKGYLADAIVNYIALLGWAPETDQEIYTLDELVKAFNVKRIGSSGAIFDIDKLTWVNGMHLRNMDDDSYYNLVKPYIEDAVKSSFDHRQISKILHQRVNTLVEIKEMLDFFDNYNEFSNDLYNHKKMKTNPEIALTSLKSTLNFLNKLEDWNETTIHDGLMNLAQELEIKNGQLLFPVRVALTGKQFTPGGGIELANILGKEETIKRLTAAIAMLEK
ncbi:MAG: glutamate--tRNA ligase [Anaerorhabdus sp.]